MRIYLHDFGGYAFIVDLGRELAYRGHVVGHAFNSNLTAGQGTSPQADDPTSFELRPLDIGERFEKYTMARRGKLELAYGRMLVRDLLAFGPDVVVSANTPLLSQWTVQRAARASGLPFVFWLQDLLGVGIAGELRKRHRLLGPFGALAESLERKMLSRSAHVVSISDAFRNVIANAGVGPEAVTVVHNWAPLTADQGRNNVWARSQGLVDLQVLLYAGTLGLKHDSDLLLELAASLDDGAQLVVVSEGPVADSLQERGKSLPLRVLPFQPYEQLDLILGSADVLVALLTPDAARFSVPSKILTYLAAGRPILAAMPGDNLAANIVRANKAGRVVEPGDVDGFLHHAKELLADPVLCREMGANGRRYAEENFEVGAVADRFEALLAGTQQAPTVDAAYDPQV